MVKIRQVTLLLCHEINLLIFNTEISCGTKKLRCMKALLHMQPSVSHLSYRQLASLCVDT